MKLGNYTRVTREYMQEVVNYLEQKYGSVPPEWDGILTMYADNIELYKKCKHTLNQEGIYSSQTGKKNPLLITIKDLQASMLQQIKQLGISPYAQSKITCSVEDDEDDFIDKLTNE